MLCVDAIQGRPVQLPLKGEGGGLPCYVVAIFGIGGLDHLVIKFAKRMGFRTMIIGRGNDKGGHGKKAWGVTLH